MTAAYAGALTLVLLAFAFAVFLGARSALLNQVADRVSGVLREIVADVQTSGHQPFGPVSPVAALSDSSFLDRYAGAGVYVEVYNAAGFPIAKSSNFISGDLPKAPAYQPFHSSKVADGKVGTALTEVGPVLARWQTLRHGKTPLATIYVAQSLRDFQTTLAAFGGLLLIVVFVALVLIAGASAWLARGAVGPISEIARAAAEIGRGDLSKRLNWRGRRDELGMLAATFDDMMGRLEAAFARERRFIADASHELKTPLTVINANAQMLERWADRNEALRREALATIRAESASMARVINAMLMLAKTESADALPIEPCELSSVVKDVAGALGAAARAKGFELRVERADAAWVEGEPGLLRQLVTNLAENAIKFTERGAVTLSVENLGGRVRLVVADTGPGIPKDALAHVFERFYRADPARSRAVEGTGLGLAVVNGIVRAHRGTIAVSSEVGRGTTFTVEFPALAGADDGDA